jgi:23S rRNA pseudouridine1911/1915/1917 synthase
MTDIDMGVDVHLDADGKPRIIERRFVVEDECAGFRLDHFLKKKIPRLSRTKLQRIIKEQLTRVDGRAVKASAKVFPGDELIMRTPARPEPACPRTFTVLYEDDHMMVVDKPAGLPMHASAKFYFNTLTRVLLERYGEKTPQICHRLDRETSGCVVLAKDKEAAAVLKNAFADKTTRKTYLAITTGVPDWPVGEPQTIDMPLGLVDDPDALINIRMVVRENALPAVTECTLLERAGEVALVQCRPITGRQHQIRAHLAAVGHPIVGDKLYTHGDEAFAEFCDKGMTLGLAVLFVLPRHALHAARIEIPHPVNGRRLTVESPMPTDMAEFLRDSANPSCPI